MSFDVSIFLVSAPTQYYIFLTESKPSIDVDHSLINGYYLPATKFCLVLNLLSTNHHKRFK